jgi:starch synthase
VASEAAPFAKTGGLADVLGSLPPALARLGDEVAVVLPLYRGMRFAPEARIWERLPVNVGPHAFAAGIDEVVRQGVRYLFVDIPALYGRASFYFEPDNHTRFAALCQAAIGIARFVFRPHIFHLHDWPTGLLPVYLRESFAGDPTFFGMRTILTIHNLGYQGNFPAGALNDLGLDRALYHPAGLEFYGHLSFLKAGIVWADGITTVSPTYALEIQTPAQGFGMDGLLRSHAAKLTGILNGADYSEWNPETDPYLAANYSAGDLAGKRACKRAVLAEMGLPVDAERPLIGIVSRLAEQKGIDLVAAIGPWLAGQDVALAMLGSGDRHLEDAFRHLAYTHPDKVAARFGYDEGLSHRIEAGADIFLMPSRYEPCGLGQIYSLRYGTVPLVHATGGLEDTVDEETGFKFREHSPAALAGALSTALEAYRDREAWTTRMQVGMARDFSWEAPARAYHRLYEPAVLTAT